MCGGIEFYFFNKYGNWHLFLEMEILTNIEHGRGAFYIELNNERLAEMDFTLSLHTLTILHTEVSEQLQGQQIGKRLVAFAADYARANQLKIIPLCPYANAVFKKNHDAYADVLA